MDTEEDSFAALKEAMDVDATMDLGDPSSHYLVADTNIFISALEVLDNIARTVEQYKFRLELLVPGA
jgi:hypothetical protein